MSRSRVIRLENIQQFQAIQVLSDPGAVGGPVVIPNCMQVVINWSLADGKTGHNVLYGRSAGVPAPTQAMADAIKTALTTGAAWTAFAATIAPANSLASVSLRSVHTAFQPIITSAGAASPGTGTTSSLPNEVALAVTLRTGLTGPQNRGRIFIPGYANVNVDSGNVVLPACMTATTTWAQGFIAIFSGQSLTLVIGQRERAAYTGITGTQHPARAAASVPVTQLLVRDNHWDSQRRRGLR